jgi:arylsulfatase
MDHLKSKGLLDNTVIVFMSDNGGEATKLEAMFPDYYAKNFDLSYEHLGEKGSYSEYGPGWATVSMTPFSNFKGSAAEGGVRAPFVIRYPAAIPAGTRVDQFAFVLDVVPTLLDLAHVSPPDQPLAPLSGRSMVPALTGAAPWIHPKDETIGYEAAGGAAVYQGDDKLVRSAPPYGDGTWRLYDLKTDPTESHDLATSQPALEKSLREAFASYAKKNSVVMVPDDYDVFRQGQKNAGLSN